MVREIEEIDEILEEIRRRVFLANRTDTLDELLTSWGLKEFIYHVVCVRYKSGKLISFGRSEIDERTVLAICRSFNIGQERVELCLDYHRAQKFDYRKLRNNLAYSVILFGAVPHSATDKGDSASIIAGMEKSCGYPPVKRLMAGGGLKITKSNLENAIKGLLSDNIICADY